MKGALIILIFTIIIGIILYAWDLISRRKSATGNKHGQSGDSPANPLHGSADDSDNPPDDSENQTECCGLHLVCEKDSLSPMSADIIYYDDEELDRFCGRDPQTYTPDETEEFREVLMTLLPEDTAGWARSLTQRRIELPADVRDELLIIINEQRRSR